MPATRPRDTRRSAYSASSGEGPGRGGRPADDLQEALGVLGAQALKERSVPVEDLESIMRGKLGPPAGTDARQDGHTGGQDGDAADGRPGAEEPGADASDNTEASGPDAGEAAGGAAYTEMLRDAGYLRDSRNWLTRKAFLEIGGRMLRDVMSRLGPGEGGLHGTVRPGEGSILSDGTRMMEPGGDAGNLCVPQTVLNAVLRLSREGPVDFPLELERQDLEEFESLDDVRTAVAYCIDLSSTMKTKLQDGTSRIEAAKRALWVLYMLNSRFFPDDPVFVVGFASLASEVDPRDIPFLRTYDANDGLLHYTNYQAALGLARRLLRRSGAANRRIVLITDGQPSACFVGDESQKAEILSVKPYSTFYSPQREVIERIRDGRNLRLDADPDRLVYLCYRYKKIDPVIERRTAAEAAACSREGVAVDSIVVSDEDELLEYVARLERQMGGRAYHVRRGDMDRVLVSDYVSGLRKVFTKRHSW